MWFLKFLTLSSIVVISIQSPADHNFRENVPRFRNVHVAKHEVYLGDEVRLDCLAITKTPGIIEWFRNDQKLTDDIADFSRLRRDRQRMILHIDNINVSDQGLWSCRFHNTYGQITRNFTVEVIDFCDYFLIPEISRHMIPMECICLWHYTKEAKRTDVDYTQATPKNCMKYAPRMIIRARKPFFKIPCFADSCEDEATKFTPIPTGPPEKNDSKSDDDDGKVTRVVLKNDDLPLPSHNIKPTKITEYINADDEEDEVYNSISPDAGLVEVNVTVEEPPYFKHFEDMKVVNETHALPAGRTLKLNCRANGHPEPQILWFKNGTQITPENLRSYGYEYRFNRWSIELEDAIVPDSGDFHCEAWNELGKVRKNFNVIIVNRMRRPPIIVPNILTNQTVNVNDTANFKCKIVSDLVPHMMWVRINKVNGSYYYYNNTASEFMFNYTEMESVENAHVHHQGDESFLTLQNVTLEDQGIYACLTGNSLGMTMANATLIVNDFVSIHLLTGDEPKPDKTDAATILFVFFGLVAILLTFLVAIYLLLYQAKTKRKKMLMDDTVGLVTKKKRVVVSKKPIPDDRGEWSDSPSPYQIQIIEQTISVKEAGQRRKRLNSENTVLSEYEVDSDPKWEVDRSRLELTHMLGEGAFGEVWKAILKDPEHPDEEHNLAVAVKKLKLSAHEKELIDLVSEMETFKVIGEHKNVLRLLGCCTGAGPLYVVVELCRHGNLRDFLRAHRPKEENEKKKASQELADYLEPRKLSDKEEIELIPHLTQRHLVDFAYQVALGMHFMAEKKIIHRDLAARNVLVADNHVLKISDFGLSRDVHCNDYYRKRGNGRLPIKWMALEALDSHVYTIESDVWSFGILLWEIMTLGGTPYPTIAMPELYATLKEGYRMEAPHNCPEEVYNIMVACWQEKRENRPSFSLVVDYLEWMLVQSVDDEPENLELHDQFYSDRSTASGPVSPICGFNKRRKHRPLSAPVNLPSEPQHSICDDDVDEIKHNDEDELLHFYCNDNVVKNDATTNSRDKIYHSRNGKSNGYVGAGNLVRAVSGVANQSLDSALGSPAWLTYDRSSNNASCLGEEQKAPLLGDYYYN